jgi:hypothetical protein
MANHTLAYIIKEHAGEDFELTFEEYLSYAFLGDTELDDETLVYARREFDEALAELRGGE